MTHFPELSVVRPESGKESRGAVIWHMVFSTGFLYDLLERWVVDMAHLRKEVVDDLIIESSHIPGRESMLWSKVSSRTQLVFDEFIRHHSISIGLRELESI